jgi:hypothetical protein
MTNINRERRKFLKQLVKDNPLCPLDPEKVDKGDYKIVNAIKGKSVKELSNLLKKHMTYSGYGFYSSKRDELQRKLAEMEKDNPSSRYNSKLKEAYTLDDLRFELESNRRYNEKDIPEKVINEDLFSEDELEDRISSLKLDIKNYMGTMFNVYSKKIKREPQEVKYTWEIERKDVPYEILSEVNNIFDKYNKRGDGRKKFHESQLKHFDWRKNFHLYSTFNMDYSKAREDQEDIDREKFELSYYDEYYTNYEALEDKLKIAGRGDDIYLLEKIKEYISAQRSRIRGINRIEKLSRENLLDSNFFWNLP